MDVVALVILIVIAIVVAKGVRVVPQQNAWVVERLGKFHAVLGPGLNLVIPFIDTVAYKHSLKEIPLDVPSQICITRDNTQLAVDGIDTRHVRHHPEVGTGIGVPLVEDSGENSIVVIPRPVEVCMIE